MEFERGNLVSPVPEVPVVEGEIVTAIREPADRGWDSKAIARELGVARNTVRRYRRHPVVAGHQLQVSRRLSEDVVAAAQTLYTGAAEHNAVVVHRLLRDEGRAIGLRTVQRAVAPVRQTQRAADVATVRVETAPGAHYVESDVMESVGGDRNRFGCSASERPSQATERHDLLLLLFVQDVAHPGEGPEVRCPRPTSRPPSVNGRFWGVD